MPSSEPGQPLVPVTARGASATCAKRSLRALAVALVGMMPVLALAQQADNQQTAQALARAQGLLRQIGQQKQQLEVDNAKLQAAVAGLEQRLKKAELEHSDSQAELASRERDSKRSAANLTRTTKRLDDTTAKLKDVIAKYKAIAQSLKQTQFDKEQVEVELAAAQSEIKDAEAKNLALYQANREILALYKNKSGWTGLLQKEPVTGLAGIEIDNNVEKYEYEMYDQLRDGNLDAAQELKQSQPLTGQ